MPTKGIIYYTDNRLPVKLADAVKRTILAAELPIVSASLEPIEFGTNIHVKMERGYLAMFTQILACLEESTADIIYFCEHDVLYNPTHFEFTPPTKDEFYYNQFWFKVRADGTAVSWDADQVSGLVCYRKVALEWYRERVATYDEENFDRKFEPLSGEGSVAWWSRLPLIDVRHKGNLTMSKWDISDFRNKDTAKNFQKTTVENVPGWQNGYTEAIS
jgi:hypothetical protein